MNERELTLPEYASQLGWEAHNASRSAGWWSHADGSMKARNRAEMIALMMTEVVEMHRGVRSYGTSTQMDEHLPHLPSAYVEAADFIIRAGDFVHGYGFDLGHMVNNMTGRGTPESGLMGVICALGDAVEADRRGSLPLACEYIARGVIIMDDFARSFLSLPTPRLFSVAREKMAYNKQRADHKMENRLKDGGKAY